MNQDDSTQSALKLIEQFDTLPLEKRISVFNGLSSQAREELVQVVYRPSDLIRGISEQEMFFTVKELGERNAPNLIRLTTGRQLLYLLDIDLWNKNMFDRNAAAKWIDILAESGEEKILQFLQVADPELVVLTLDGLISVRMRDAESDIMEQLDRLPVFTLDDLFYIHFREPNHLETIKHFLEVMINWNPEFYFSVMEELLMGTQLENEEQADRWRQARLSEKGFPEFDEVLDIYKYMPKGSLSGPDLGRDDSDAEITKPFIGFPLKLISQENLFKKSLDEIEPHTEKDRISEELGHLANKVIIADGLNPGSVDDLRSSLCKVSGYINMALEEVCGSNIGLAVGILRSNHMEILFRRGFSLILDLRKDVMSLLREYEGGVENLGYPLAGLVKGILERRPFYAGNFMHQDKRDFQSLDDIHLIKNMIDKEALEDKWESI